MGFLGGSGRYTHICTDGWETARVLAQKDATVIMACRSMQNANTAADQIKKLNPGGKVVVMPLDLGDLDTVRASVRNHMSQKNEVLFGGQHIFFSLPISSDTPSQNSYGKWKVCSGVLGGRSGMLDTVEKV